MVTKNEIIYDLLNTVRSGKGALSDDEQISLRWLSFQVDAVRAQLIRQDLNKDRTISNNIRQSLGCVSVEAVDASLCCNFETDCTIYRTEVKIPRPIELEKQDLITRVGPASVAEKAFEFIPYERAAWAKYNPIKALANNIKAFYFNDYIFIMVPDMTKVIQVINVQGVFETPEEVKTFNTCDGEVCYTDDQPYPISEHMIPNLKKIIIENSLRIAAVAPSDQIGDGTEKLEQNTQK